MNTFGEKFRLTTYGESHGPAVGGIIDGCPAGIAVDLDAIRRDLARRRNGAPRQEEDNIQFLSGLRDGITLGTPIAFEIPNRDAHPDDYANLEHLFRPGHADFTYFKKYGLREYRGSGRASARETVVRVVAGSLAKQLLNGIAISTSVHVDPAAKQSGDTYGGTVQCTVTGLPIGLGEPIFGKLNAHLAFAMLSIPSAIGFEMGAGFSTAQMTGSEYIDRWNPDGSTRTNHCGGVQGGISNGMPVEFRVAFHPVVSLPHPVECLHEDGSLHTLTIGGRHDLCQVYRAAVVVEAMTALTLANYLL